MGSLRTAFAVWLAVLALPSAAVAAPGVAPGYPDWSLPAGKSHFSGREICPSDLRHKITVVAIVEAAKAKEQLDKVYFVANYHSNRFPGDGVPDVSDMKLSRDTIGLISIVGPAKPAALYEFMGEKSFATSHPLLALYNAPSETGVPILFGEVTFAGAPVADRYPFVYVMGPEGTEPLYKGAADSKAVAAVVAKARKDLPAWVPYFGSVTNPKGIGKTLDATIRKGKPLDALAAAAQKGCLGKDPELAKESQIVYDALEQTRSDLLHRIKVESRTSPQCAGADIHTLVAHWPKMKKRVEAIQKRVMSNPDIALLVTLYVKCAPWMKSDFACKKEAEAKKIVAELNKAKRLVAPYKESKTIAVQNLALSFDLRLNDAISAIPTKVQTK